MGNKRRLSFIAFLLATAAAFAQSYANVTYAEGGEFRVIRDGATLRWDAGNPDVFGMEIRRGDIINTGSETVLEISIHPVGASVQIAENTSFACNADETGVQSRGELYYGRVRAKVAKLASGSSFRVSSPSLVAGVRGTDFGCDVIVPRTADDEASSGVLSRVFCFEGSVAVTPVDSPSLDAVMVGPQEMVELSSTAAAEGATALDVTPIAGDVHEYWESIPAVGYMEEGVTAPVAKAPEPAESLERPETAEEAEWRIEGPYLALDRSWPRTGKVPEGVGRARVPNWAAAALMVVGTSACSSVAIYARQTGSDAWFVQSGYSAGLVMTGTGALLAVLTSLFD